MLEVLNVTKSFPEAKRKALDNVSFCLPSKGLYAIVGPSGSGKSTLLSLLGLNDKPTFGSILFDGKNLVSFSMGQKETYRRKVIGFLYQSYNLYLSLSPLQNVELPLLFGGIRKKEADEEARSLFKKLKLENLISKETRSLSGGEKQRLSLLRALINHPQILLADEPTGALDEKNSRFVMETLKEVSQNTLVILVSHNENLVHKYAQDYLELSDGKVVHPLNKKGSSFSKIASSKGTKKDYQNMLLNDILKKDKKKNILAFLSSSLAFIALIFSIGFFVGSKSSLESLSSQSLLFGTGSISKKEIYNLPNSPLSLSKSERPKIETLTSFLNSNNLTIVNDYSYFFPSYASFTLNQEMERGCYFSPLYLPNKLGEKELSQGVYLSDSLSECVVNEEFLNKYQAKIGDRVALNLENELTISNVNEDVPLSFSFMVVGVVKELEFLNSPRVYYSYGAIDDYFSFYELPSLSLANKRKTSIKDVVEKAYGNESYCSFAYLVFALNEEGAKKINNLAGETLDDGLVISSSSYTVSSSYESLVNALSTSLLPFLFIELGVVVFIIGALAAHSFNEKRKDIAISLALGAKGKDLVNLFINESLLITFLAMLSSLVFTLIFERLLNYGLESLIGISNLVFIPFKNFLGVPYLFPLLLLLSGFILAFLGSSLPLFKALKSPIFMELKEE